MKGLRRGCSDFQKDAYYTASVAWVGDSSATIHWMKKVDVGRKASVQREGMNKTIEKSGKPQDEPCIRDIIFPSSNSERTSNYIS